MIGTATPLRTDVSWPWLIANPLRRMAANVGAELVPIVTEAGGRNSAGVAEEGFADAVRRQIGEQYKGAGTAKQGQGQAACPLDGDTLSKMLD